MMTPEEALTFVRTRGVVLLSARGPAPRMVEVIAGEAMMGGWWGHPRRNDILRVVEAITSSPEILVCQVVGGKISLVHRRLWPALIRVSLRFPAADLVRTSQEHTAAGPHVRCGTPFPDWADPESLRQAKALSEEAALAALGAWAVVLGATLGECGAFSTSPGSPGCAIADRPDCPLDGARGVVSLG